MICPVCNKEAIKLTSAVVNNKYLSDRCDACLSKLVTEQPTSSTNKDYRIRRQQEDHRADMLQPYVNGKVNMDFARVYKDKAKDYFTDEQLRKAERE